MRCGRRLLHFSCALRSACTAGLAFPQRACARAGVPAAPQMCSCLPARTAPCASSMCGSARWRCTGTLWQATTPMCWVGAGHTGGVDAAGTRTHRRFLRCAAACRALQTPGACQGARWSQQLAGGHARTTCRALRRPARHAPTARLQWTSVRSGLAAPACASASTAWRWTRCAPGSCSRAAPTLCSACTTDACCQRVTARRRSGCPPTCPRTSRAQCWTAGGTRGWPAAARAHCRGRPSRRWRLPAAGRSWWAATAASASTGGRNACIQGVISQSLLLGVEICLEGGQGYSPGDVDCRRGPFLLAHPLLPKQHCPLSAALMLCSMPGMWRRCCTYQRRCCGG